MSISKVIFSVALVLASGLAQCSAGFQAKSRQHTGVVDSQKFAGSLIRAYISHWFCDDRELPSNVRVDVYEHPQYFYGVVVEADDASDVIVEPVFAAIDKADGSLLLGGRVKKSTPKDIAERLKDKYGKRSPRRRRSK